MAIRPADLQLAYLAAPQSAALVNAAQSAPQAAQAAAQAAFAAQIEKREETIAETDHAERTMLRTNPDGGQNAGAYQQGGKRRHTGDDASDADAYELGDDEHFIDVIV